jgi:hypothetical protein
MTYEIVFLTYILPVLMFALAFTMYMGWRNNLVYAAKMKLLNSISKLARERIDHGQDFEFLYTKYDRDFVYYKMLWQLTTFKWELDESYYI